MNEPSKIILLTDARLMLERQKKELLFYKEHQAKLLVRIKILQADLKLTEDLIRIVEKETVANNRNII